MPWDGGLTSCASAGSPALPQLPARPVPGCPLRSGVGVGGRPLRHAQVQVGPGSHTGRTWDIGCWDDTPGTPVCRAGLCTDLVHRSALCEAPPVPTCASVQGALKYIFLVKHGLYAVCKTGRGIKRPPQNL